MCDSFFPPVVDLSLGNIARNQSHVHPSLLSVFYDVIIMTVDNDPMLASQSAVVQQTL